MNVIIIIKKFQKDVKVSSDLPDRCFSIMHINKVNNFSNLLFF